MHEISMTELCEEHNKLIDEHNALKANYESLEGKFDRMTKLAEMATDIAIAKETYIQAQSNEIARLHALLRLANIHYI